jgi:hypothetical protein
LYKIEQICSDVLNQSGQMNKKDLTREETNSVPCPTCGVGVGKRCILYSGGLRSEPHLVRKIVAIEALDKK